LVFGEIGSVNLLSVNHNKYPSTDPEKGNGINKMAHDQIPKVERKSQGKNQREEGTYVGWVLG